MARNNRRRKKNNNRNTQSYNDSGNQQNNDNRNDDRHDDQRRSNNGSGGGGYNAHSHGGRVHVDNRVPEPTRNRWAIRDELRGGRQLYINGKFYDCGDTLPKMRSDLFQQLRDENVIEMADVSADVVQ